MAHVLQLILGAALIAHAAGTGPRLPVPEFEINLDLAPEQRYNKVIQSFNASIWTFYNDLLATKILGVDVVKDVAYKLSKERGPENDELQGEIRGISQATNIPLPLIHAVQMLYELNTLMVPIVNITWPWDKEDKGMAAIQKASWEEPQSAQDMNGQVRFGCTGIIATNTEDGTVTHARNLDFSFAKFLQPLLYTGIFTKGGKEVYRIQTVAAYPAVLTGMRKGPNGYSVEVNTRYLTKWGGNKEMFHNLFTEKRNFSGWTKRKILENIDNYEDAVAAMSNTPYVATEFNIISGVKKGVILGRDPDGLAYNVSLNDNKYIIITNFDTIYHDIREWFDPTGGKGIGHPRRIAAEKILKSADVLTPEVLFGALNDFEVMAKDTIFQALINVQKGTWNVSLPACTACGRSAAVESQVVVV